MASLLSRLVQRDFGSSRLRHSSGATEGAERQVGVANVQILWRASHATSFPGLFGRPPKGALGTRLPRMLSIPCCSLRTQLS